MLCIGLLYNSCSHLSPIRLLILSLNFIIFCLYASYKLTVCSHGLFCTAAVDVIQHFGFFPVSIIPPLIPPSGTIDVAGIA